MKKILGIILLLSFGCKTHLQEITHKTKVTYKVSEPTNNKVSRFNPESLEFELIFDSNQSIFQLVDKLDENTNEKDFRITKAIFGGNTKYYKKNNTKEKKFNINQNGQLIDVMCDINEYNWEIIPNEIKVISGYKCYKAISSFERKHNGTIKETFKPYVWFTSQIPTSFGPVGLDGLPGLVLEGSFDGSKIYYATSIKEVRTEIKKPEATKTLTFEEYCDLMYNISSDRSEMRKLNK